MKTVEDSAELVVIRHPRIDGRGQVELARKEKVDLENYVFFRHNETTKRNEYVHKTELQWYMDHAK